MAGDCGLRQCSIGKVAALFVQPDGCYSDLPMVDAWDESRDARKYQGPHPVVAHPPCARWSRLAGFCEARHGLKVGDDGGCFAAALKAVRKWGGVLEHPAFTKAWAAHGIGRPRTKHHGWQRDLFGGWSCYVEQGRYGHPVKKATWLYAYGMSRKPIELKWGYTPDANGKLSINQDERGGMDKWRNATGHKVANATPIEFRDTLLAIARQVTMYN